MTRLRWRPAITGPGLTSGAAYGFLFLFLLTLALTGASLMITARYIDGVHKVQREQQALITRQRQELLSSCKFHADLGGAPITVPPGAKRPSVLGVAIIADARQAWHGLDCPGKLAPPGPGFARWARYYHLPAN